jgi:cation transport ATPase
VAALEACTVGARPGRLTGFLGPNGSGTVNAGGPFDLRTTATVDDSTFASVVRLVKTAEASSAAFVRLADRHAGLFLGVTMAMAALAWMPLRWWRACRVAPAAAWS